MRQYHYAYYALALLFAVLSACAQVGLPTPATLNERLAVGYSAVIQVRQTALQLLEAKKITGVDAANVQLSADQARAALDIARSLSATDLTAAGNKLQMATAILTAAQAYLATRQ